MSYEKVSNTNLPEVLDHDLNQYFPELLKFNSLEETEKSAVYQKIKPTVERILNAIVQEDFSESPKSKVQSPFQQLRGISNAEIFMKGSWMR